MEAWNPYVIVLFTMSEKNLRVGNGISFKNGVYTYVYTYTLVCVSLCGFILDGKRLITIY